MFDWFKVTYEPSSVSVSPRGHVAVGGAMDNKVHLYELKGTDLAPLQELDHLGAVTDVAYSPDDNYLVACDAHRKVVLYSVPEYKLATNQEWGFHNARVNSVAWSPDSLLVASGSLDTSIIIWSVEKPAKHIIIKNAHAQSQVTRLAWLDNQTLVSVGQDCNTKLWTITKF
jgi:WD40 repeat protein